MKPCLKVDLKKNKVVKSVDFIRHTQEFLDCREGSQLVNFLYKEGEGKKTGNETKNKTKGGNPDAKSETSKKDKESSSSSGNKSQSKQEEKKKNNPSGSSRGTATPTDAEKKKHHEEVCENESRNRNIPKHSLKECRGPMQKKDLSKVKCNACEQMGHYATFCPTKGRSGSAATPANASSTTND